MSRVYVPFNDFRQLPKQAHPLLLAGFNVDVYYGPILCFLLFFLFISLKQLANFDGCVCVRQQLANGLIMNINISEANTKCSEINETCCKCNKQKIDRCIFILAVAIIFEEFR